MSSSPKIDARKHHDPASAPGLIDTATAAAGSQKELAARLGVTPRYLRQLSSSDRKMTYVMQAALEAIIAANP